MGRQAQNNPYSTATHPETVIGDVLKRLVIRDSLGALRSSSRSIFARWVYFLSQ